MSEKRDTNFVKWYEKKDFTILEMMKPEVHREYYCRSAWFARDDEVKDLQEAIDIVKGIKKLEEVDILKRKNKLLLDRLKSADRMLKTVHGCVSHECSDCRVYAGRHSDMIQVTLTEIEDLSTPVSPLATAVDIDF